ncbi:hypothetical protein TWF281_008660 [Arthrobotrys megalospora]
MAPMQPFSSIFGIQADLPQPPSLVIEETLKDNPFMTAAAGKTYMEELPSTWRNIPRIATTAFTVPLQPASSGSRDAYESGYGSSSRSTRSAVQPVSSATSLDFNFSTIPRAPILPPKAQSEYFIYDNANTQDGAIPTPSARSFPAQQRLPQGFVSKQVSSDPGAYLIKHDSGDAGIILTPNGEMKPFYHAQKQSYFDTQHPFPPPVTCYDARGLPLNVVSYSHPPITNSFPPINPIRDSTSRIPVLGNEIIPTFDIGYYPDILRLPSRPSDVLIYFNSVCGAAALSPSRRRWIDSNTWETETRFCNLDDIIFEMCEALGSKPLRGPNGELPFHPTMAEDGGTIVPRMSSPLDWAAEIEECRNHLARLNRLAYIPVMNKCKVDVVWKKMVEYRDDWANMVFSQCQQEFWEASMEDMESMKDYHAFNREMLRLIKGVEDDLIEVMRLENMVTAFRGAVWKADMKLKKIEGVFGITTDAQRRVV